jgi:GT2 family glycosyltransferase
MAARGRRQAEQASWSEVARSYLAMYRRAVHDPADNRRGVEVVVVAYGRPDLLERSLLPVLSFPVTVVDNSSSAEVAAVCERLGVRYLDPGRNGGFGAGVNYALTHRTDPHADVLLLNPDAVVERDDVLRLQQALISDPALASVAPSQVDEDGHPSRVTWPFPTPGGAALVAAGLGRLLDRRLPRDGFVIGSVMLLRVEALEQVGGFDESFFLYAEETDWAFRAHQLGWRHREVPEAHAVHLGAATSADTARRDIHFHAGQERYLRKHYGSARWHVARGATLLGAVARAVVLPGARGREARARAALYLEGPLRAETTLGGQP